VTTISPNLVLTIPHGSLTATSLGLAGLAWHLSPGSGKHFHGRTIFVDLAMKDGGPGFDFLDEGGWRDAAADTVLSLQGVNDGKKTKTALSNNAFSAVPLSAYKACYLVKTEGHLAPLDPAVECCRFTGGPCGDGMSPSDVAKAIGHDEPAKRVPRLYAVFAPIEILVLSSLAPAEYAWYATHRRGKVFRQVAFAELKGDPANLAAASRYEEARAELTANPTKKTKTVAVENLLNRLHFREWVGYGREGEGGLYLGDHDHLQLHRFPAELPTRWENAH